MDPGNPKGRASKDCVMISLILATAIRYLLPLLLLLSVYILLRGHNAPGGGFIGGLVASSAFALLALAHGVDLSKRVLRIAPRNLITAGLFTAGSSGCVPLFFNLPFMTGLWFETHINVIGKLGTPFFFDLGVFLVVLGVTLMIIFSLMEE